MSNIEEDRFEKRRQELLSLQKASVYTTMENMVVVFILLSMVVFHLLITLSFFI